MENKDLWKASNIWSDRMKKLDEDEQWKKSIQIASHQAIKGPDTMANLAWANTNISGYVI